MDNGGAMASDDCSDVSWTYSEGDWMSACGYTGSVVVTFTATDDCGNSSSYDATYTVVDTTDPIITEAIDETVECNYEAMYSYNDWIMYNGNASAYDDCSYVTWSYNVDEVIDGCGNTSTTVVTFTATDDCGNSASTTASFITVDTVDPYWTIEPIIDIYLYDCGIDAEFNTPEAADECGAVTITYIDIPRSGGCPQGYSYERVFTATDECGNSIEASSFVHVNDQTAPTVDSEAMDMTVECDGSGNDAEYQTWLDNRGGFTASDNCGEVTYSFEVTPLEGCSEFTGGYYVVFTATDACDNSSSSDATFTIDDTTAPELVGVPDNILDPVECDQIPAVANVTATDDCSDVTLDFDESYDYNSDEYMCNYAIVRTWTATDECGNATSATQTINVTDNTAPVFDQTIEAALTVECGMVPEADLLTGSDNCTEGVLYAYSEDIYLEGGCPEGESIQRTYTLTDMCGNTATQVQIITVVDTQAPVLVGGPTDGQYDCIDNVPAGSVEDVAFIDECSDFLVSFGELVSGDGCTYTIVRTWTAVDDCGNSAEYVQNITVVDEVAPWIEYGPMDMTVSCANLVPDADNSLIIAGDNCDDDLEISHADELAGDDCNATLTRTYTAMDDCGNTTDWIQVITIHDDVAPEIVEGPADLLVECYDDVPSIDLGSIIAMDNCQAVIIIAGDVIDGNECQAVITRTYTVSDGCGNSTDHVQTITVNDDVAPVITDGPEDLTVACIDEIPAADTDAIVATDNCSGVTITVDGVLEGNDCYATMVRTYAATDECGNVSYYVHTITVMDDVAPIITSGPMDASYQCVSDVPAPGDDILASDNCGGDVFISMGEVIEGDDCDQTITRTWVAYDMCENASTPWVQVISVMDDTAPELVGMPEDIDIECGDDIPEPAMVSALDNCAGEVPVDFEEINNAPENPPCILETPFGQGGSWAIWLPFLEDGDLSSFWVFDANGGVFTENILDGTATITGNVVNTGDPAKGFEINIDLQDRKNWEDWHDGGNGGSYKDDFGYGADYYETWSYYILSSSSTLVGSGDLVGSTLNLTHAPVNQYYGIQVGIGANNIGPNYGGGGWFDYSGVVDGLDVTGNGDVGFDGDCSPCDYTILRTWTAVDNCGNEVSETQTINVISVPEPPLDNGLVAKPTIQEYAMLSAFPNPFTDKNNIEFQINEDADVILSIYNTDGKLIDELYRGKVQADQMNKFEFNAVNLPSGVYIYKLITPKEIFIERVVLTR